MQHFPQNWYKTLFWWSGGSYYYSSNYNLVLCESIRTTICLADFYSDELIRIVWGALKWDYRKHLWRSKVYEVHEFTTIVQDVHLMRVFSFGCSPFLYVHCDGNGMDIQSVVYYQFHTTCFVILPYKQLNLTRLVCLLAAGC